MNVGTGTKTTSGGTDSDSGQTNSAKEDKQYIQISPETVELIAETIGITNLDTSTAIVLAEDASYRCREVANICGQLMRHAKRRKLTAQDVNEALDLYDADPVLGHDATDPVSYTMLKDNTSTEYENLDILYVPDEKLVDLRSHALSQSPPVVAIEPSIQATWLSVEGHYCPENEEAKPVDFPQQANVTPALMQYYSTIISVTLGDSEVMMNTITKDLEVNTNIGTLLPFIVSFIRTGMQKHCENKVLMRRLLCLLQSLFSNSSLNLSPKPYLSHLVTALLSSLIVDRPGQQRNLSSNQSGGGMWNGHNDLILNIDHVQHASRILRQVLNRWATPVNQLRSQTHRALREYLKDTKISYSSHFGALSAMIALGPEVLEDCLLPQIEDYVRYTKEKMENAEDEQLAAVASFNRRNAGFYDNQKKKIILSLMWGTLLAAGRSLLAHYTKSSRKLIHSNMNSKYATKLSLQSKVKQREGEAEERSEVLSRPSTESFLINSVGQINISKVYDFLYDEFGSSMCMFDADWNRISKVLKKNNSTKGSIDQNIRTFPHYYYQMYSSYKRGGNAHKYYGRNPLECVGRMRIRTLGKKEATNRFGEDMYNTDDNGVSSAPSFIKKEEPDCDHPSSSSFSQMDFKYFGEERTVYQNQPRPTSSTSSDADFNYLAGCGLPSDIFEPSTNVLSGSPSNIPTHFTPNLQNVIKLEQKNDAKKRYAEEEVALGSSVTQHFELAVNASKGLHTMNNKLTNPRTTVSRHSNIVFSFGTSQWPKQKLKRKHLTSTIAIRYHDEGNNAGRNSTLKGQPQTPKIVVAKRMGTPRGVTSTLVAIQRSCSLMSFI